MPRHRLALIAMASLVLTGCGAAGPDESPAVDAAPPDDLSFTDATGTTGELAAPAERVVCLTDICADILYELELKPVALRGNLLKEESYYGAAAADIPEVGGSFNEPSLEDVAAAEPDLIIGLQEVHEALRSSLEGIAPVYLTQPESYEDSVTYLRDIGRLLGRTDDADAQAQAFLDRLNAYKEKSPGDKTVVLLGGSDVNIGVETQGTVPGSVLSEITEYPWPAPAASSGGAFVSYSIEQILQTDPDVIFVETFRFSPDAVDVSEQLQGVPLWGELDAVQESNVHEVPPAVWAFSRGTHGMTVLLDTAMPIVYPDVFDEPLP